MVTINDAPKVPLAYLDPATIKVDAATYQFRSHADGVTGVTAKRACHDSEWDEKKYSRPLLVHQRLDGTCYVADGHHRVDLLHRLHAQGKAPKAVAAYVFREADGYSPLDVKLIAAFQNLSHHHTEALDVARVLREARSAMVHQHWLPSLQFNTPNMQVGLSLSFFGERALDRIEKSAVALPAAVVLARATQFDDVRDQLAEVFANQLDAQRSSAASFVERLQQQRQNAVRALG
jgi:hypothetical protein